MSRYVVVPPPVVAAPVAGGGLFPVRRIYCIGRNYADHAREMGHDPAREAPFFFSKPADALVLEGADTPYPPATADLHHEIELVAAIGRGGRDFASAGEALGHVWFYAAGLDLTRRDLQAEAKTAGRPWDMAKGFDASAPLGLLAPVAETGHPETGAVTLRVNGELRQSGDLGEMIWSVGEALALLSRLVMLAPGDLVFTGTPSGVGALARGDRLEGRVEGVGTVATTIV